MPETTPVFDPVIQLHPQDNVAIALMDLYPNMQINLNGKTIPINAKIPLGHKVALQTIQSGEAVYRYGWPIGNALDEIHPGDWAHTHNVGITDIEREFDLPVSLVDEAEEFTLQQRYFQGYLRKDGRVGTRNYLAVISAVNCVNPIIRRIQQHFTAEVLSDYPNVDGFLAITVDTGCSIPINGLDHQTLQRVLCDVAVHPNIVASLVVGLGCEVNQMAEALAPLEIPLLVVQDEGGSQATIEKGIAWGMSQLPKANICQRSTQPLSKLSIALQCGGSDAFSGITGNPLVGEVVDQVVLHGGTAVIAETTEIFGAEQLLLQRCKSTETRKKLQQILQWWQDYTHQMGMSVDNNPSPGNKKGGLTTIFEKSLGAVSKCGHLPLDNVLAYAEQADSGLCFMDSPGNDVNSVTGQLASGCTLLLFTTGRGTTYAPGVMPCLKVATNTSMYRHMESDMDFNAGQVLESISMDAAADELLDMVIAAASGQPTKSEPYVAEMVELVPWRRGAVV